MRFLLIALCAAGCASAPTRPDAPALSPAEKAAAARLDAATITAHVRALSDDQMQGRKPGTPGSARAVEYLVAQLKALGLQPALGADFRQPVPLVELTAKSPSQVTFRNAKDEPLTLSANTGRTTELTFTPAAAAPHVQVRDAELVFVGYGIVAPEYGWDDYKNVDVRGKIAVILNFNPPFAGEVNGKRVRLWYGRWDYKYQEAAAHGASGALIVHTTESAGYPWQVLSSSGTSSVQQLPPAPGEPRMQFEGWLEGGAAHRLVAHAGASLDALVEAAQHKEFVPRPLGTRLSLAFDVTERTVESHNVLGMLPGTDPELRGEAVIYTAHHDHLGTVDAPGKDGIYNGAVDNASGCATVLAIAKAAVASPPRRSLIFAFVTGEEQGLLGSKWLAQHPPVPAGRIAAGINIDSVNIWGRTSDVGLLGLGKSTLDAPVRALAQAQGRPVHGDAFPDRGSFYRSDQFSLARIGVPVAAIKGGPRYEGKPDGWGEQVHREFEQRHYHQPSDEWSPSWDLSGALQDAELQLLLGLRVANADALPQWTPGDEFEKARKAAPR